MYLLFFVHLKRFSMCEVLYRAFECRLHQLCQLFRSKIHNKLLSCCSDEGTNATSEQVGSLLFTTVNDEGQKENGKTLVCYGKTNDEGPIKYTYTLTNDDGAASFTGSCSVQDGSWMIRFFDITSDYGHKKIISNIKIYDSENHLIGTVE